MGHVNDCFPRIETVNKIHMYQSCRRWVQITGDKSAERYRERRDDSDDDEGEKDVKPMVKTERLSPCEQDADEGSIKILSGLHLTFNLEAGSLLPLAIRLVVVIVVKLFTSAVNTTSDE